MSDVTEIMDRVGKGDAKAANQLLPLVYRELRQLASAKMAQQAPGQTLQATALVHEAWLKLTGKAEPAWNGRQHFFRAAAEAMRQILVDRARAKQTIKRGADQVRIDLEQVDVAAETPAETLLLVDEALAKLALAHPNEAELVKLRFYVGMNVEETAAALGVSEKTVKRHWVHARAWLYGEISRLISADTGASTKDF